MDKILELNKLFTLAFSDLRKVKFVKQDINTIDKKDLMFNYEELLKEILELSVNNLGEISEILPGENNFGNSGSQW